jgi:hypothetical protein
VPQVYGTIGDDKVRQIKLFAQEIGDGARVRCVLGFEQRTLVQFQQDAGRRVTPVPQGEPLQPPAAAVVETQDVRESIDDLGPRRRRGLSQDLMQPRAVNP